MMRLIAPALLLLVAGCGASTATLGNAVVNTGLAVATSAAQRAQGGCYSTCTHGLVCNSASGLCERRPCGLGCAAGQFCDDRPGQAPSCREMGLLPGSAPANPSTR